MNTDSVSSSQERIRDVLIIGAGPAGLTAAYHLSAAGHDVLLLDRCVFPREKVCGDGLVADSIGCLQRMGLAEQVRQQARIADALNIRSRSGHEVRLESGFWTIKRVILDALLWRHARSAGAAFQTQTIDTIWYDTARHFCCAGCGQNNQSQSFTARYGIISTGTSGIRNDRIGIMPPPLADAMAVRCYVRSDLVLNHLEGSFEGFIAPGYAWIFPLRDQEYNVGCIRFSTPGERNSSNMRTLFARFQETHPVAKALFAQAKSVSPLRAHPLRCGRRVATVTDGVATLLAGETIGTTYPFTGEGIGKAMETGETAAQVLDQALRQKTNAGLRDYPGLLEQRFSNAYEGYAKAQRWLFRKGINDIVTFRTARSSLLQRQISRMILNELAPASVLTPGNILRSFFS